MQQDRQFKSNNRKLATSLKVVKFNDIVRTWNYEASIIVTISSNICGEQCYRKNDQKEEIKKWQLISTRCASDVEPMKKFTESSLTFGMFLEMFEAQFENKLRKD